MTIPHRMGHPRQSGVLARQRPVSDWTSRAIGASLSDGHAARRAVRLGGTAHPISNEYRKEALRL